MFAQLELSTAIERIQKLHDDLLKLPDSERLGVPCVDANLDNVQVSEVVAGSLFKAVTDDGEGGQQEALFTVIGVLGSKDLPPVAWRDVQTQSPLKLSQSLVVYGCGTPQFDCVEQLMADVNWMASQHLAGSKVYLLDPVSCDQSMGLSLTLNTRYFTPSRSIIPDEVKAPFGPFVDPRGTLGRLRTANLDHCLDNAVQYLEYTGSKFEAINPAAFHTRDVVQASFAINIFRTLTDGEPQFAVKAVLRAVGRLDCQFAKEAYMASQKASAKHRAQPEGNADERKWKHMRLTANPLVGRTFETKTVGRRTKQKGQAKPAGSNKAGATAATASTSGRRKVTAASSSMDLDKT
ncbi:hypothetical protein C8F01DRAFT_1266395 [Mycena amicta]|nr:hypothetical protein C8F01DRAFT_1268145 [Mycena amicta]KAJ7048963.1 hypothetical protein C8F01DRAFT_1266395 [Mycena amicta]